MSPPLLGMEVDELREALGPGQPPFRARQVYEALYRGQVSSLSEISTLPVAMRREVAARHPIGLPEIAAVYNSTDGTRRYLLRLEDGRTVETVLMPEGERDTLCISSQVGCAVGCTFCLTALLGMERNLTAGEIVGQILLAVRDSSADPPVRGRPPGGPPAGPEVSITDQKRVQEDPRRPGGLPHHSRLNIVMMGQGEPLLNLPNVLKAARILLDPAGFALSPRRITLSTAGIVPKIAELGQAPERPKLAVSLNASNEEQRRELMPITRKYHLKDLMEACKAYPLRPWEKLTFEYVLLAGVNDSDADGRRVARLLANLNCKVNLIALNPGPEIPFQTPSPERVASFQQIVKRSVPCFIRKPRGLDIFAACGQLKRAQTQL